ncbi:MAG: nitrate reductase [Chloroflexi bacterium]|jgi:hydroxylamine dehydrogenase|nr:nitrate reductase [Chloroflexota bacterium]MBT3670996.1 nitrate reductase [Chloroflexota bacterium]MBT4305029.1 nitrate reductase [Chloroflexota bacterium]MBT4533840.1 nitrate reductase [Chloroflexota bacterium]MBT4681922.1 nitrate reductase [Chloroflexota bacterium]
MTGKKGINSRALMIGLIAIVVVIGFALVSLSIGSSRVEAEEGPVNALANSKNDCVVCHDRTTPGIIQQYGHSTMAAADVTCEDCHEVERDYPGGIEHEGTYVLQSPTTAMCQSCHENEVNQYYASRHALPAYVAMVGAEVLDEDLMAMYQEVTEGQPDPDRARNAIYHLEGPAVTRFACEGCHNIGKPAEDGSVGECQQCHLRHEFSLEQVRKPETCSACHIGPDHPQFEIYQESPHGISYAVGSDDWNWDADPGTLTSEDFPAPTCATCHFSGFGGTATTHDSGDRLTWFLFMPVSERRPGYNENAGRMQQVCGECHNSDFIDDFYTDGDALVEAVNAWVLESREIIKPLQDNGLLTADPFDEPIDFVFFDLWHHWGRTAKFGGWMQGPDYTQWHGAYEVLRELAELKEMVHDKLEEAGIEP